MISSKSCLSVLAGREWDVGAGRAKPRCHHTLLRPFSAHVSGCVFSVCLEWWRGRIVQVQMGLQCAEAPWGVTPLHQCNPCVPASSWRCCSCPGAAVGANAGMETIQCNGCLSAPGELLPCTPWGMAAGCAGVCGGSARAGPEGRHGTPGLEGQQGAGTVCSIIAVSPCLGNK